MSFEGRSKIEMSVQADGGDKKGKKEPEQDPNKDQNGVPKELWPYRDEMSEWAQQHLDTIGTFLEGKNARFNMVFGMGFSYAASIDTICLSVPEFKNSKEGTGMNIEQIMFGMLHEFAHRKTMEELDPAGKHGQIAQFKYEERKRMRDKDNSQKTLSLFNTYRHFYNVLEDGIVNHLVKQTAHFGENVSPKRAQEIKDAYTDLLFVMYNEVGEGNGEYAEVEDPKNPDKKEIKKVGKGKGNLVKLTAEDHEQGIDFTKVKPDMMRSGQFMTFFIKNQMLDLDEDDIQSPENPNGKFVVHEDVERALNGPIDEVYEELLNKVLEKYKDDPAQLKRYIEFMTTTVKVANFEERNGKVEEVDPDFQSNVMNLSAVPGLHTIYKKHKNNQPEFIRRMNDFFDNLTTDQVNTKRAKMQYKAGLRKVIAQLGIERKKDVSFLDIFEEFKTKTKSKKYSWTFPLKHNQSERSKIMRTTLEPIFTMLCILDDSFDVTMPEEKGEGEGGDGGDGGDPDMEEKVWSQGDKIINVDKNDPNRGKIGIITQVTEGKDGEVISVTVEYSEEREVQAMAGSTDYTYDIQEVFDPYVNLNLYNKDQKKQKGKSSKSSPDKRKNYFDDKDDDNEDGDDDDDNEDGEGDPQETNPEDQDGDDTDLKDIVNPLKEALEQMIEQDQREANLRELEEAKKSEEYKEAKYDKARIKKLLEALDKAEAEAGDDADSGWSGKDLSNEGVVKDFIELEKKIRPYADKMAKNWLEVVNNIASRIEVFKDKYYRSGKLDVKRLQKHFPEIEMGIEVDDRLIYEQLVERVISELRPKMLRMTLAIDNSGSMSGKIDQMRMSIMLLNSSLRSFRILFRDKMREILGDSAPENLDIICDTQLWLFGNDGEARKIKEFDVQDLSFLDDEESEKPQIDIDAETISTLRAFKKINASEVTFDADLWIKMLRDRNDPELKQMIADNKLTEVVIQICDGGFLGKNEEANENLAAFKGETGIGVGGFAIGDHEGDEAALEGLSERHGKENVIRANTPEQIVESFSRLLKKIIAEKVEKSMNEILDGIEK